MAVDQEDFEAWRGHPVTELVFKALRGYANQCREEWIRASWEHGEVDPVKLAALRTQAMVAQDLAETDLGTMQRWANGEFERD